MCDLGGRQGTQMVHVPKFQVPPHHTPHTLPADPAVQSLAGLNSFKTPLTPLATPVPHAGVSLDHSTSPHVTHSFTNSSPPLTRPLTRRPAAALTHCVIQWRSHRITGVDAGVEVELAKRHGIDMMKTQQDLLKIEQELAQQLQAMEDRIAGLTETVKIDVLQEQIEGAVRVLDLTYQ